MKKLIAYSSIAHMGFVTLGIFIAFGLVRDFSNVDAARLGLQGAMVQMISHGFISGAMFSCVGVLYDRMHTRMIRDYGGVANVMPWFAAFWIFFAMANSGLPGTCGFVGEFMVILASFQQHPLLAFAAATTLITGAAYTLWLAKRVIWGDVANAHVAEMQGHQSARMDRARRVRRRRAADRRLAEAADRPDGTVHRATGEPARRDQALRMQVRMTPTMPTAAELLPLLPELVLVGAAFALLMLDLFLDERRRIVTHVLSIAVLLVVAAMIAAGVGGHGTVLNGMFVRDTMADVLKVAACVVTALSLVYAWPFLRERDLYKGEVPVLMLFAVAGMMLLISAGSLVMVYLGLEMLALCSYALVAIDRDSPLASEAAMKYFVLGSLASGLLLYGMSLLYGATGTLDLAQLNAAVAASQRHDAAADRHGVPGRRHRLQVRRGAVPHVAAGHLPRCADADHRVHRLGAEAGRVRDGLPPARSRRSARSTSAGGCCSPGSPCCRWWSATWSRWCRPTSSACWRIRRSRTSASCSSAWPVASRRATRRRCSTRSATRSCRPRRSARSWCWPTHVASRPIASTTSRA